MKCMSLSVLFFDVSSRDIVLNYDFIINDILGDYETEVEFLFSDQIADKKFDIFIYNCFSATRESYFGNSPDYETVLNVVKKVNPKIIIQLSDEYWEENHNNHNQLANHCQLFLRQYSHWNHTYTNNTIQIPLGYLNNCLVNLKNIKSIEERNYSWSWVGYLKNDRQEMIDNFSLIDNHSYKLNGGVSGKELFDLYSNSKFVPIGRGNSSIDCWRIYEAIVCGAIPVIVADESEINYVFRYEHKLPAVFASTWEEAKNKCVELLKYTDKLFQKQRDILEWWNNTIDSLQNKIKKIFPMETLNLKSKLNNFPRGYYMSLEESVDRRINIANQFAEYGVSLSAVISKRFSECDDVVTGQYIHQLNAGTTGCCVSHLKAIKHWYDNYPEEDYAFFCEDDLSLETVNYWDFTWEEFIESLPEDAECVQLMTIRGDYDTFELRERYWDDWAATAYIITRDYAKKIIDTYIKGDTYHLEIPNSNVMPLIENILFTSLGKSYTIPLFIEDVQFGSTFSKDQDDDVNAGQKRNHYQASIKVLEYWRNKFNYDIEMNLQQLITEYSIDTENPIKNFNLGVWYETNGHTAPALSYYLRCAERADDLNLAYEALIRGSYCYEKQGTRDGTAKSLLQQALCLIPNRPEAYFLLSRFSERREWWQDCYIYADQGLMFADHESYPPLNTGVEYPGKYGLLFEKAVSGYWWGKNEECKEIFLDLKENYPLTEEYRKSVNDNLKGIGVEIKEEKLQHSLIFLSSIFDSQKHNTDKNDLGYLDHFYDEFFSQIKNVPVNLLEIGVYGGGSIKLWKDCLHSDSKIYGGDTSYFEHIEGTYSIIGDMYSYDQVSKFEDEYFDVVIDDGPHSFESFVLVMQRYFSKLKKGGTLVIEDVIVSSWVEPLVELSKSLGYSSCKVVDMTGKQKTQELLDSWKDGLFILKIVK